ncbi:MAG TPA: dynamin family protein [Anaerolineaceae bacterium]|nr:dynamin family protein [Anaerolineaceae bacterium]
MQILDSQQEAILHEERKALNDLRVALVQFGASPEDADTLGDSIAQLDELFLLVIVGEFNSGKSSFINALLGQRLLAEGVTPTTTQIQVLRYGESQGRAVVSEHQHEITLPAELLEEISIVDTPGTNAIIREHETITAQFVPRADLVLFITSADRPFTESERLFLAQIRDWGKKIVLVINKVDILQTQADQEEVRGYVGENARDLLGTTPDIFLVSARNALQAKQGHPQLWAESGFEPLETYIHDRLDEKGRLQLKLLSPLGTGLNLARRYQEITAGRLATLDKDFQMLADVDRQLAIYAEDLWRDFRFRLSDVENALLEMEQRGDLFFEDTFRLARVFDLTSKERIQREFEQKVVADAPQRIEAKVNEIIDWLVEAQLHQWQAVIQHISERRKEYQERIIGDAGVGSFNYDRERIIEAVGRDARRVVDTFDRGREAKIIADGAQATVATSLAIEISAVGIGALVTALATSVTVDITGIVSASLIAALGLFVIPARRVRAKKDLNTKVRDMRERLVQSLTDSFNKELARSQEQIHEAIAPYSRFIRAENGKLKDTQSVLDRLMKELERLKGSIEDL